MTSVLISSRGSFVLLFSIRPSVLALFLGSVDDVVFFFSYKDALAIFLSHTMESKKERERGGKGKKSLRKGGCRIGEPSRKGSKAGVCVCVYM